MINQHLQAGAGGWIIFNKVRISPFKRLQVPTFRFWTPRSKKADAQWLPKPYKNPFSLEGGYALQGYHLKGWPKLTCGACQREGKEV